MTKSSEIVLEPLLNDEAVMDALMTEIDEQLATHQNRLNYGGNEDFYAACKSLFLSNGGVVALNMLKTRLIQIRDRRLLEVLQEDAGG